MIRPSFNNLLFNKAMKPCLRTVRVFFGTQPAAISPIKSIQLRLESVLNLDKYPWLLNLHSPTAKKFIQGARESIEVNGVAFFPDFITNQALQDCITECNQQSQNLYQIDDLHNIYYMGLDKSYDDAHIRNRQVRTRVAIITNDRLSPQRSLKQIYHSVLLKPLIEQVLQKKELYRSSDPLACCSVNVLKNGWSDEWHFDETEFSTTLMLQRPEKGGKFEVASAFKLSDDDYAFDKVEAAVDKGEGVNQFNATPGTLAIFNGHRCLHRVTQVEGSKDRYVAVLTFSTKKKFVNSPDVQQFFFGRINQSPIIYDA